MVFPDDTARARRSDPLTSHEAADSNNTAASRREVVEVLTWAACDLSDEAIVSAHERRFLGGRVGVRFTPSRLRTARHELAEAGVVVEVGEARTRTGRRCKTWALAQ